MASLTGGISESAWVFQRQLGIRMTHHFHGRTQIDTVAVPAPADAAAAGALAGSFTFVAPQIHAFSVQLGHVPIIDPNPRRAGKFRWPRRRPGASRSGARSSGSTVC
jgi:hypothetical protein